MVNDYPLLQELTIDHCSVVPKYIQLAKRIRAAINSGLLRPHQLTPSINELSFSLDVSRDTVEKSYRHLKETGILRSVPGKGYYVKDRERYQVLLLFNDVSDFKRTIYDAFVATIGGQAWIDFFVYNNDVEAFEKLLRKHHHGYTHLVVMPPSGEPVSRAREAIKAIPRSKLVLVDRMMPAAQGDYAAVYEDFYNNIYHALERMLTAVSRYHHIKVICSGASGYALDIAEGVRRFCKAFGFSFSRCNNMRDAVVCEGDLFITITEEDLITLSEKIVARELQVGKQVGIISYHDAPYKRLFMNGITTVSTDFHFLGKQAARMIMNNARDQIEAPFHITMRNSL